jgi:hypothetical protein
MADTQPDVVVTNHGSIATLALKTQAARDWVSENIPDDAPWFGGQLAVEPRFVDNVVDGMMGDGLVVA